MSTFYIDNTGKFERVSKDSPCEHCGKPDYCYRLGDLSLCARQDNYPMAEGWVKTSRQDDNGHYFYAPLSEKIINPKARTEYNYLDRQNNPIVRVVRIDDGEGNKKIYQKYFDGKKWHDSLKKCDNSLVPIYRYSEIRKAIADKAVYVFVVEGEKCADRLWELGLPATTTKQGLVKWLPEHTQDLEGARDIVLVPDRDRPGVKKMQKVANTLTQSGINFSWLYTPPNDYIWSHLPDSSGADIADWIATGVQPVDIVTRIQSEPNDSIVDERIKVEETEENFTQQAYQALYGDRNYIAIAGELYSWNGNFYERVLEAQEKRRIAMWCQSTAIPKRGGGYKYGLASTSKVEEIYKWALLLNGVDPTQINPPGINCKNGVVEIIWDSKKPQVKLSEPDPSRFYTYCSEIEYNPKADTQHCDRLLACLEAPQREIFLKTIAASFDLDKVRKYNSGNIKALLLQGTGSNGKDSLWQAVAAIVGETMTQISFSDFQEYDKGRKFNVARLQSAKICWASENSEYISLDNVQVLKQAITGEKIAIEQKNAPAYLMDVNSVFLFNVNQAPLITAGLEAIRRRYAVLDFNKTYCKDADPKLGQIEADPRYRYDMEFLNAQVAPALLNYLLSALESVVSEGINYDPCEDSLDRIKKSSNHLWEFVEDVGLVPDPGSQVFVQDIYELLEQWYIDNDILEIRNGQKYWEFDGRKGNEPIKSSQTLYRRLREVFPGVSKGKSTTRGTAGKAFISGLTQDNRLRRMLRTEAFDSKRLRIVEDKQPNYSELEFLQFRATNLTKAQRLQLQEFLQNLNRNDSVTENEKNSGTLADTNIANRPQLSSTPPPHWDAASTSSSTSSSIILNIA